MKEWLKSFSREQLTFATCAGLAVLFLLMGIVGGGPQDAGGKGLPVTAQREYGFRPSMQLRSLEPDFEVYWRGRNVFQTESTSLLPIPPILAALPRPETPVVPLFRPTPPLEVYNRTAKVKYPALLPKALITDADLISAADFDALKALEEPAPPEWKDKSQDREQENCEFFKQEGEPRVGKCSPDGPGCAINEDAPIGAGLKIKSLKTGQVESWEKGKQIKSMKHAWKNIDQCEYRSKKLVRISNEAEERYKLGLWCYERGMLTQAKDQLLRAIELKKGYPDAVLLLGQIYEEEGNFDAALGHYAANESTTTRDELRWRSGECLRKLGLYEAALAAYAKSAEAVRFFKGKVGLARMQMETGQPNPAITEITGLYQKFGKDSTFTADQQALAYYVRGRCYLSLGDYARAVPDLEAAGKSGMALTALGACHAFEGRWKDAAAAFHAAILADQYSIDAWTGLASLYVLAGKLAEAEELYKKAGVRDPSTADASSGQALCQIHLEKFDDARKAVDLALQIDPTHVYSNYLQGELAVRGGDLARALDASRAALRGQPLFLPAYYATATACLLNAVSELGDGEKLGQQMEPLLKSLAVLGKLWGFVAGGQIAAMPDAMRGGARENLTRAEILYRQMADLDANRINLQIALGCTYALLGEADAAKARLNQAKGLVNQANLKQDPLIEYALGFLQYRYGTGDSVSKLEQSIPYFKNASEAKDYKDPVSTFIIKEAAEVVKRIQEWRSTSLLIDENFNRGDSDKVSGPGGTWIEVDRKPRVAVGIREKKCVFAGEPGQDWIPARLDRDDIPIERFSRLDVTFLPEPQTTATFEFGISLYAPQVPGQNTRYGVHFGFDRQRNVRIATRTELEFEQDKQEMSDSVWQRPTTKFVTPQEIRLRLERKKQDQASTIDILIWDSQKKAYEKIASQPLPYVATGGVRGGLKASFWVRGWKDQKLSLSLDDVKIYEKRDR